MGRKETKKRRGDETRLKGKTRKEGNEEERRGLTTK